MFHEALEGTAKIKNAILKKDPNGEYEFKLKTININGVKRGCSGFIKKGNNVVYISTEYSDSYLNYLYRYAKDFKDYTGHNNQYAKTFDGLIDAIIKCLNGKSPFTESINNDLLNKIDTSTINVLNDYETEFKKCEVNNKYADCYEVELYDFSNSKEPFWRGYVSTDIITSAMNGESYELDENFSSIKKLNEELDKLLEGDVVSLLDYKKQKEIDNKQTDKNIITIDSVKCEWVEGPQDNPYFKEGSEYSYEEFQKRIFEYDYKIWNAGDYRGGYDKLKFTANITINGEKETYTDRIDLGDGKYGKEYVSIVDNMKNAIPNAEIVTKEPPYLLKEYEKKFGTHADNQEKYLNSLAVKLPEGEDYTKKTIDEISVGDIFYDSWTSYDDAYPSTYYSYYRVTRRTKSSIWVEKLDKERISIPVKGKDGIDYEVYSFPTDKVIESRDIDTTKPLRLKEYSNHVYATQGRETIRAWNGKANEL